MAALFADHAQLLCVATLQEAAGLMHEDVDLIVCGMQFHDSQMFDFLHLAKAALPQTPFVCCRVLETRLQRESIDAVVVAALAEGAAGYVDLPSLCAQHGRAEGERIFRERVMAHSRVAQA